MAKLFATKEVESAKEPTIQEMRAEWFKFAKKLYPSAGVSVWAEEFDPKEIKKLKKGMDLVYDFFYDNEATASSEGK